jgi:hypothetical protein
LALKLRATAFDVSGSAIDVALVLDPEHDDLMAGVVDAVKGPVGSPASGVDTGKVTAKRLADALGVVDQGACEELDDGRRDSLRQVVLDCSDGWRRRDEIVGSVGGRVRRERTASGPRTTSPPR